MCAIIKTCRNYVKHSLRDGRMRTVFDTGHRPFTSSVLEHHHVINLGIVNYHLSLKRLTTHTILLSLPLGVFKSIKRTPRRTE